MAREWHIRVRGKRREKISVDQYVRVVIALGKQLRAEEQERRHREGVEVPSATEAVAHD